MTPIETPDLRRRADVVQFRVIYAATLPAFFLGALASRLVRATLRGRAAASGLSVFGEARAAARTCGSFALMG